MKRETYERALRSAAQVSFLSLPLLSACAGPIQAPVSDASDGKAASGDGDLTVTECERTLKEAYPKGDPNWYGPTPTARADTGVALEELVQCCRDMAGASAAQGNNLALRDTGCCSLHHETNAVENIGLACTPWG